MSSIRSKMIGRSARPTGMSTVRVQPGMGNDSIPGFAAPNRFRMARNDGRLSLLTISMTCRRASFAAERNDHLVLHEPAPPVDGSIRRPGRADGRRGRDLGSRRGAHARLAEPDLVERAHRHVFTSPDGITGGACARHRGVNAARCVASPSGARRARVVTPAEDAAAQIPPPSTAVDPGDGVVVRSSLAPSSRSSRRGPCSAFPRPEM